MVELPPMPPRIAQLERDKRGYPVPRFVDRKADHDGEPDFRYADQAFRLRAYRQAFCWVCGDLMGRHRVFVIGPMCVVNRITMEPPSHRECAEWSAKACPFLSKPRMRRNEKELAPEAFENTPGIMLPRNPGAVALYEPRDYKAVSDGRKGWLIRLGEPVRVDWMAEGRPATRAEIEASIESGYPALRELAEQEGRAAIAELERMMKRAVPLLPAA